MVDDRDDLVRFVEGLTGVAMTPMQRELCRIFQRRQRRRWETVVISDHAEQEEHAAGWYGPDFREGEKCD